MSDATKDWSATLAELDELVEQRKYIPVTAAELARERPALERIARQAITALTLATQRAQSAEAERDAAKGDYLRACQTVAAMHEAALGEITGPKRGVVEDVADLRAERDALRKDAALMNALQTETDRFDPVVALVVKCRHDRNGSDWANVAGDIRAALDAALAVQPTTEGL